jgi:SAM-dependent methyltransferase
LARPAASSLSIFSQMVAGLRRRARRPAGLLDHIDARVVPPTSMALGDLEGAVDFVFAFAVVHEMPGPGPFFTEAAGALKPDATLLLAEPAGHVDDQEFARELAAAVQAGLTLSAIRRYTVVAPRCCANQPPEWRLP